MKCDVCPSLLRVQLRVLSVATSALGYLIEDDDAGDGGLTLINHGDFDDDRARRPLTLTSLAIG